MFDRFGLVAFEAVPLSRFGLEKRWKKLAALQDEAQDLIDRYQEALAKVAALEQGREDARDKDLTAQAAALRRSSHDELPGPEHELALDKDLEGARRSMQALQRATEGAIADVNAYRAKHAASLAADIQEALSARASTLAEHARQAAAIYAEVEDGKALAQRFGPPPPPAQENTGEAQDTTVLIGPMSTGTVAGGPPRGEVEAVLAHLASLGSESGATTIVGAVVAGA
jgi:hypothetical protein